MPPSQAPILQIVEVIGPAEQGMSLPYLCRAEDGNLYYVKGLQTNRSSLWAEWISAHVASAFGLAIPPFSLVQVDEMLLDELPPELRNIGCLPAFGSRQHPHASWLELSKAKDVSLQAKQDILVFDWWVKNPDRGTGNPNLLWDADQLSVVVIDHNQAFSRDFDTQQFLQDHVFAEQWPAVVGDLVTRDAFMQRLADVLHCAQKARLTAPPEWMWENPEFDLPTRFDLDVSLRTLSCCTTLDFWRTE